MMNHSKRPALRDVIAEDPGRRPEGIPPDALELAAWLEGRLSGTRAEQVERWLALDPQLRRALAGLETAEEQALAPAEAARARALVPASRDAGTRWRWLEWLLEPAPACGLAVVLVVCGFFLGAGLGTDAPSRDAQLLAQVLSGIPL